MFDALRAKLLRQISNRPVERLAPIARAAAQLDLSTRSDHELSAAARTDAGESASSDEALASYLAASRELADRRLGMRPFEVQLHAAAALLRGLSVEQATGEGKTLVLALAAACCGLAGRRVHVLSANDYLAERDAQWMGPLFSALGLSVASVTGHTPQAQRRERYAADIVYVPVAESGFDLLRDRIAMSADAQVSPVRDVALIDEADAVLLDEATVPLVLSAEAGTAERIDPRIIEVVESLERESDFAIDDDARAVHLTDAGLTALEEALPGLELFGRHHHLLAQANVALHARHLLRRDVDYVVRDGRAWLVSQTKGRVELLHRWPEGLQSAVEAKEGLKPSARLEILDQVTIAELVRGYRTVVGTSATLWPAAEELFELYGIEAGHLPPNAPCIRVDEPVRVYELSAERDTAALDLVHAAHSAGQPVLVGTPSVARSEEFAAALREEGLDAVVLNARQDAEENAIIARAGEPGRITVSTQMAGRGTDIRLADAARDAGGLLVIGLGAFPSTRLDDQLRGRAGRQGDPGRSIFLASLEDELIQQTEPNHRTPTEVADGGLIRDRRLNEIVGHAQRVKEGEQQSLRGLTHRYGRLLRIQRGRVLERRQQWLTDEASLAEVWGLIPEKAAQLADQVTEDAMHRAARTALLASVDRAWTRHLDFAAQLREGIHLQSLARKVPLEVFNDEIARAFGPLLDRSVTSASRILARATVVDGGLRLNARQLGIPSATWAYTVSDYSLGSELDRMGRKLKGKDRRGYY